MLVALALVSLVTSEPRTEWRAFWVYFPLILAGAVALRVPLREVGRRLLLVSPAVLMTAALLPLSQSGALRQGSHPENTAAAVTLLLKAYASVAIVSVLVLSGGAPRLIAGVRGLGVPAGLVSILTTAVRHGSILRREVERMRWARASRTPGRIRMSRVTMVGQWVGALFVRAWHRAETAQHAMESRGFAGKWPELESPRLTWRDVGAAAAAVLPFLMVRLFVP
jgi:cobalt/nickel transport system permease protein